MKAFMIGSSSFVDIIFKLNDTVLPHNALSFAKWLFVVVLAFLPLLLIATVFVHTQENCMYIFEHRTKTCLRI